MRIWSLSSRRCSTAELAVLVLSLAFPAVSFAKPAPAEIKSALRSDLNASKTDSSFDTLIQRWEKAYGTSAVAPLLQMAADTKGFEDHERYVALMAAAKLGGPATAPSLTPFLKDKVWMIRSGALRALRALKATGATASQVLPLLKDPALVVRNEAVDTVEALKPEGSVEALLDAIEAKQNYHGGKAQWVPQNALAALVKLQAKDVEARLKPLLAKEHAKDPALQKATVETLDSLSGKKLESGKSLQARVKAWDEELSTIRD